VTNINFTYLPGDGIGPEVGEAAMTVLNAMAGLFGHTLEPEFGFVGGAAIDELGMPLPDETYASCKMNLYANIRPCKPYPALIDRAPLKRERLEGTDFVVMRELTGGIYFGQKGRDDLGAFDECRYSEAEVERIAVKAFDLAMQRRKKVTSVDKSNVLETSRLWRETVIKVSARYPEVQLEHLLVDAMTMHMLTKAQSFDVILTGNMFGDILTDEASVLAGSMGVIPSASLSDGNVGLYEPIHGSAPDITGQGKANPIAMILSAAWMLRLSFGLEVEATAIETSVENALNTGHTTGDLGGSLSTKKVGEWIAENLNTHAQS